VRRPDGVPRPNRSAVLPLLVTPYGVIRPRETWHLQPPLDGMLPEMVSSRQLEQNDSQKNRSCAVKAKFEIALSHLNRL
jgi:hypothetical protein